MADNTYFDMTAVPLKYALEIAFANSPSRKASHWNHDRENNRIILAWSENAGKEFVPFLTPINAEQALAFFRDWLNVLSYGSQPDHDGENERSFRIYCEDWGYVGHNHYAFAAIEPRWAMYGK